MMQLFGSKRKPEDKIKGIYMYGSVGKSAIPYTLCIHLYHPPPPRCWKDNVNGLVL
jgi:hypothetical protein